MAGWPWITVVPEQVPPAKDFWWSKLHCPRCQRICAAEHCHAGSYRIYCKSGDGFVTCSDYPYGVDRDGRPG